MKNNSGFIATSLLYSFFLGFIALFMVMVSMYLQNRVYLNKLEDSSKEAIVIQEIKDAIDYNSSFSMVDIIHGSSDNSYWVNLISYDGNVFTTDEGIKINLVKCPPIYYKEHVNGEGYYIEECSS